MLPSGMALTEPWIEHFFVGPLQMRCSVVTIEQWRHHHRGWGDEPQRIIDWIDRYEGRGQLDHRSRNAGHGRRTKPTPRRVVALVNTHAHLTTADSFPSSEALRCCLVPSPDDTFLQTLAQASGRRYGLHLPEPAVATIHSKHRKRTPLEALNFKFSIPRTHPWGAASCSRLKRSRPCVRRRYLVCRFGRANGYCKFGWRF